MKRHIKVIALILVLVMVSSFLFACKKEQTKQYVGKVNGMNIPDGVFINYFFYEMNDETSTENWKEEYKTLYGKERYDALVKAKIGDKSYFEYILDNAIEETRLFLIEYQVFSAKDTWPKESEKNEIKKNAETYIEQMSSYYGTSFGVSTPEDFVKAAYCMQYDELIEFFVMSGCLTSYKDSIESTVQVTDDIVKSYFEENKKTFNTVEVRHSLLKFPDKADKDDKAELLEDAQELVDKYNEGKITFDDIMKESEDVGQDNKPNNDGYYTVYEGAGFVKAFEEWGLKQTEASDKIEIVETEHGYHIMKCTKVLDTTDKDVYDRVKSAYIQEKAIKLVEEEIKPYKEDSKYKITSYNKEYAMKLAKRAVTGEFEDENAAGSSASATGSANATATPAATSAPENKDAEMDKTVVGKYRGDDIYKACYAQFFSQAMNKCLEDYDFTEINNLKDEKEYFAALKELFKKEYKDGKTYLEYSKEEALNLMLDFLATKDMAIAADKGFSDEKKSEYLNELDQEIDSMLAYYGESYNAKTRDELVQKLMGMNVNDYKQIYVDQMLVDDYSASVIDDIETDGVDLKAYYEKDVDSYRVVTVRLISKSLLDNKDELISAEEQAKVEKLINTLKDKYEKGDSAEALAVGYSDSLGSNKGLVDLTNKTAAVTRAIRDWAFAQTEVGAVTIIKTNSSYELVVIEGLADYNGIKGTIATKDFKIDAIHDAVESAYKSETFNNQVDKFIKDNNLKIDNVVEEVVESVVESYLAHLDEDAKDAEEKNEETTDK